MIGLSRFRSATVKEPLVKVAYVSPETAEEVSESGTLHTDPGYLGTGCLVEALPGHFQLKTVGVTMEDVVEESDNRRSRSYRWVLDEPESSCFLDKEQETSATARERIMKLLKARYQEGLFPIIDVWVIDDVTEEILDRDYSVKPPKGVYRQYSFVTVVNYPFYNEYGVYMYDEYVCLVTDMEEL